MEFDRSNAWVAVDLNTHEVLIVATTREGAFQGAERENPTSEFKVTEHPIRGIWPETRYEIDVNADTDVLDSIDLNDPRA